MLVNSIFLQGLALFLEICWLRLPYYVADIFVILIEAIIDATDSEAKSDSSEIQSLVKKCLDILKTAVPKEFNEIWDSIKINSELYSIIASVFGN